MTFPEFLPFPRFPDTISPGFGSVSDVIIGRSGTSESTPRVPRDIASSYLCWSNVGDPLKSSKDILNMAIVVSSLWSCQDFLAKLIQAVGQLCSKASMAHNLRLVKDLVDQASAAGAKVR